MNNTAVKSMVLKSDRCLSAEGLAQLLLATPIIIATEKGTQLGARKGLGGIVYIKPIKGRIRDVKLGAYVRRIDTASFIQIPEKVSGLTVYEVIPPDKCTVFEYRDQRFDVSYSP